MAPDKRQSTRRGRGKRDGQARPAQQELKPFRNYEASQHCSEVLTESQATYWTEAANHYMDEGESREAAARMATADFKAALDIHRAQCEVEAKATEAEILEQAEQFKRTEAALRATQRNTGRRRRSGQGEEGLEHATQDTERRNKLADQLAKTPSGRRRRSGLSMSEEERIAKEGDALRAYQQQFLSAYD